MDDLGDKLSEILNDPEAMEKVRMMAENLLGDEGEHEPEENGEPGLDGETVKRIMGIMSRLKSSGNDSRTALLTALKPHISESRRHKVDTAIKLLKLIEVLPYLKDSGLLDF